MHLDRMFVRSAWRVVACGLLGLAVGTHAAAPTTAQSRPPADQAADRSGRQPDRAAVRLSMASDAAAMRQRLAGLDTPLVRPAVGSYDVVALRVEFVPDTSRFTTGNGTFDHSLFDGLEPSIDPLPHDDDYFEAHLAFLRNYVERVSDGGVAVRTHLLPGIVRVPKPMGAYAPTGPDADSDEELSKLAGLVVDAWRGADREIEYDVSSFTPKKTAFVIFHAGVGRDIELTGTTLEKTPQDLPSLFFDRRALDRLDAAALSFNGFPVDHTMILPRTETRLGTDFVRDEPFLFELSINGLMAASFFNFLGVPDLFDTESGQSAIGPFGLMDPLGIFAYRGLFPPEPMAWTRQFLGWTDPVVLDGPGPASVDLAAASLKGSPDAARAEISGAEYFLIENRFRDPEGDGLTLRIRRNGVTTEQHFENGDPEFNGEIVDAFRGGVVVGVDNYDWALPGGVDEDGDELNGGILIWHVDERRLKAGILDNSVNVGATSRAVDLEEADGAQDIGFPSGPFGPRAEVGSPFDFFYEGNPASVATAAGREIRLYENQFGPETHPGSETNAGGPSFIVLEAFAPPDARMSFDYRREVVDGITPAEFSNPGALEAEIEASNLRFDDGAAASMFEAVPVFYSASSGIVVTGGDVPFSHPSLTPPAFTQTGGFVSLRRDPGGGYVVGSVSMRDRTAPPEWIVELPVGVSGMTPASPLVRTVAGGAESFHIVMSGPAGAALVTVRREGAGARSVGSLGDPIGVVSAPGESGSQPFVVGRTGAGFPGEGAVWTYDIGPDVDVGAPVFGRDEHLVGALPIVGEGTIELLTGNGERRTIDVAARAKRYGATPGDSLSRHPVLVDLDRDGRLDVLIAFGRHLVAFSQSGAMVDSFPILLPEAVRAQPLVLRFEGSDEWAIIAAADDGYLYGLDARGRRVPGFPLEVGEAVRATPVLRADHLYSVSRAGTPKAWELPAATEVWWGELHRTSDHDSFVFLAPSGGGPAPSDALIDPRETYNWPNPVQDGSTHFRIRTSRDARVRITVIDAGGGMVDELDMGSVAGGVPSELLWQADVESGLYFARFTATDADGEKETRVVKVAVIQ